MSALFHPVGDGGQCRICKRRHHPGRGCPKWRKWSERKRTAWLKENPK